MHARGRGGRGMHVPRAFKNGVSLGSKRLPLVPRPESLRAWLELGGGGACWHYDRPQTGLRGPGSDRFWTVSIDTGHKALCPVSPSMAGPPLLAPVAGRAAARAEAIACHSSSPTPLWDTVMVTTDTSEVGVIMLVAQYL
eukprot:COSAG02_NODE_7603_length_2938_cov_3.353293_1_plen_140_part_10